MIQKLVLHLFIIAAFTGCRSNPGNSSTEFTDRSKVSTIEEADDRADKHNGIEVKDSFDYSKSFLKDLEATGIKNVQLIDDQIIIGGGEQYQFPNHLMVFRMNAFFGEEGKLHVKLLAERINQTTIAYTLLAGEGHDLKEIQKGSANLAGDFFLLQKADTNDMTGNTFPVIEYVDRSEGCMTSITIGREANSKLMARISKSCEGRLVPLATPTALLLQEK